MEWISPSARGHCTPSEDKLKTKIQGVVMCSPFIRRMQSNNLPVTSQFREIMECPLSNPADLFHSGCIVKICAPMVRYSKLAFRTLVRKYSCDLCYTPMIVAADFVRSVKARHSEFTTNQGDHPLIVQFAAKEAQVLADAACIISPFADGIDLNCGCPQRWAMAEGYGACLINKPELVQEMVRQVRNRVENSMFSVSIKIRIHGDLKRTVDLCQKAEAAGVSWITVHGRNVEERHQPVHYDAIKIIKQSMSIPVVANGDMKSLKDVEEVHQITGTDGKNKHLVDKMTFQWTAVAAFLYAEIAIILILCIPVISPLRWQKIFFIPLWSKIATYWNKAFLAIIVLLIVLFLDAVREVRKYSNVNLAGKSTQSTANAYDHIQMKLFRSQRNLYLSGFSLFLWLVLRRTISLITLLASEMRTQEALEIQVENTNAVAKKSLEENEKLLRSLKGKKNTETGQLSEIINKKLKEEMEKLKAELNKASNALTKTKSEITAVKKQSEGLIKEYGDLAEEHKNLQENADERHKKVL
ncbi:tRNA-dihydrouridine(20a/20b) synthase [NAD(P)+]-like isoform X4 [Hemicordylus capensis]|uniref:tRNA-dihydrouridine(20a/20b) synthase [NAD(P)+]-like isoform X4 n=1 Tax=Hemicordylus capensis TaxID=884348 RepID=UPI002304C14C|nr:tRNA-dihydrouridine(20a/20b) synthase [NAD(P)+]-like isoform X4 [Hemicordylus capensis]